MPRKNLADKVDLFLLTWLDHRNTNMIINVYMKLIVDAKGTMDGCLLGKAYRGTIDGGEKS